MKGDAGDTIIGSVVLVLALLTTLGAAQVPFMIWVAEASMVIVGILMVRGDLGAHPRVGYALILAGPTMFILPGFFPEMSVTLPIIAAALLWIGGIAKMLGAW